MKEKAPKSTILVIATMMFLAMFIILPPLLRAYLPKEEEIVKVKIVKHSLYCEKVFATEKKKTTSRISYENDIAVKNVMTIIDYTPTEDETKNKDKDSITAEDEINYLRSVAGAEINENTSQIVVTLTQQNAIDNSMDANLLNYLGATDAEISYFEGRGFVCSKIEG